MPKRPAATGWVALETLPVILLRKVPAGYQRIEQVPTPDLKMPNASVLNVAEAGMEKSMRCQLPFLKSHLLSSVGRENLLS